ncbi:MAG: acetylglutamate kinase [Bacillota bacterium]|nr:acetylglutamate kinase [Bacillota bacterium]
MNLTLYPLGDYIQLLQKHSLLINFSGAPLTREVALVSCDSRQVVPGTLFLCKGAHFKVEFLRSAMEQGAFAYIAEKPYEGVDLPCLQVTDVRLTMALLADFYYNHPSGKLSVVGITGTKGKSSTTYYLKYIFDEYLAAKKQKPSGVVGGIETYDGVERFESHLTTPEPLDLERHFANGVSTDMRYLTMEVSSQALKYDRVVNVEFAAAVFLNIGTDHISPIEHPDFEDYFSSKLRIFAQAAAACVNLDSDHADRVLEAARKSCARMITFSTKDPSATIFGSQIRKVGGDILFKVKTPRYSREFRLTMPGLFNVQNALAALAVCEALGIPEQYAFAGLMKARVPGRMEVYSNADEKVSVIVDYAHNKLSFETLFQSVKEEYPGRRVVTIFGCPGYKAYDRRKDLGEISGKYSDLVILTEEDPGEEPVENICRDIAQYVENEGCDYTIVPDRGEAIRQAVLGSQEPTIIILTGKGAETRQKRGIEYIDCPSDVEYSKKFLHEYDVLHGMDGMSKVRALLDVLPLLRRYEGRTLVIKYGGSALDAASTDTILEDAAALQSVGVRVVLVHGGGKEISALLDRMNVETKFENGYRVTDQAALEGAEMALSARVNKAIVGALDRIGARACGVSGRDGGLITARQKDETLGLVGTITKVDPRLLTTLLDAGYLPVVSPIARGEEGTALNCNADDAARAVAEAVGADKLVFLTDTDGILVDSHNQSTRIARMDVARAKELIDSGLIAGGMIPKTMNCIHAVEHGVGSVTVLDGRMEHAVLLDAISEKSLGTTMEKKR